MLFKDKEDLLSLYNAVNGTNYTNVDDLEINTLENAIYMNMKNDLSFIFNFSLNIYEHQSTNNPNIPLRNLFYVAKLLEKIAIDMSIYGSATVSIPRPTFVVFYNGIDTDLPESFEYKLSDLYIQKTNNPDLELRVKILNINNDMSYNIRKQCRKLEDYCQYVSKIREFSRTLNIEDSIETAIDYCIQHDILKDFLIKQKAEVKAMSIFEYNEEEELRKLRNAEREAGVQQGIKQGIEQNFISLIQKKIEKGKTTETIADELEESIETIEKYISKIADEKVND